MVRASTSRRGCQCAIRIVTIPVGGFVEGILDIVHEPKHFGSSVQSFRKIIVTVLLASRRELVAGNIVVDSMASSTCLASCMSPM